MRNRFAGMLSGFACLIAASAFADDTKPVVEFFATGGTIAMKIDAIKPAPVPATCGEDLIATCRTSPSTQGSSKQPLEHPLRLHGPAALVGFNPRR